MAVSKKSIGFRKTADAKQGAFKPARGQCTAGVGVVSSPSPKRKAKGK